MESSIQFLSAIAFLVTGLSHILQPQAWAAFFIRLREQGESGVFAIALMTLPMGLLIVAFHNVWSGPETVLTVIGWAYCLKALIYFTVPQVGLKMLSKITPENAKKFVIAGVMLIAVSGVSAFLWWTQA